jgi:hypothetical protein
MGLASMPIRRTALARRGNEMLRLSAAGTIMAVIHVALLALTVALIVVGSEPEWPMYWTIFLALDFPVSLAVVPLAWLVPPSPAGPLSDFANFWWPLAVHGVIGTAWWYVVGMAMRDRLARFRAEGRRARERRPRQGNGPG